MKKVLSNAVFYAILLGLFGFAVSILLSPANPLKEVKTGSMEPTLPTGSNILLHRQTSYKPGDILTFRADKGEIVTHRFVELGEDGEFIMKGDANPTRDYWSDPVVEADVIGKVIYMTPVVTREFWTSSDYWRSPAGIGFIICLLVFVPLMMWNVDSPDVHQKSLFSDDPI